MIESQPVSDFFPPAINASNYSGNESSPFNTGVIRFSARIFENKPIRERNRQIYEFFFNDTTVGNIKSSALNTLDSIYASNNEDSSRGIGIMAMNYIRHTFLCKLKKTQDGQIQDEKEYTSSAMETEQFGGYNSQFVRSTTEGEDISDIPRYDDVSFFHGDYNRFTSLESEQYHSCFIQSGSIYTDIDMSYLAFVLKNLSESIPFGFGGVAGEKSDFISSLVPDVGMRGFAPVFQKSSKIASWTVEQWEEEGKKLQDVSYISVNCSYPGNFYEQALAKEVLDTFDSGQKSYIMGEPITNTQTSYHNIPPGKHMSFKKLTPIFPGEDFSVSFRRETSDESVATTKPASSSVAYLLKDSLKFIDPYYREGVNPNDLSEVPPNFAVARFVPHTDEDGEPNGLKLSNMASDFSSEPYVIIEIDGGINHRYFLIIANNEPIRFIEVTDSPELVDIYGAEMGFDKSSRVVEKVILSSHSDGRSNLLYEFDISGERLLKEDRFKVSFQHTNGALRIKFDNIDKPYVISREKLGAQFQSALNNGEFGEGSISSDNFNKIDWVFSPIKLRGFPSIHIGHYSVAFNFSPITYTDRASIDPVIPVPVLGFFGARTKKNSSFGADDRYHIPNWLRNQGPILYLPPFVGGGGGGSSSGGAGGGDNGDNVTSMLLRTKGAPFDADEDGKSSAYVASAGDSTPSSDDGESIPGSEEPYYKQQATRYVEIVNGSSVGFNSDKLPESQLQLIPGIFSSVPSSVNYFVHGSLLSPSVISCKKTRNTSVEAQDSQYAFQYNPSIDLIAGSVSLSHPYPSNSDNNDDPWDIHDCIRPICYGFTSFVSESKEPIYDHETKEVGQHVKSFSDNWSRSDRTSIEHNGDITFFLSRGGTGGIEGVGVTPSSVGSPSAPAWGCSNLISGSLADDSPFSSNMVSGTCSGTDTEAPYGSSFIDETEFLTSLQDKTFYIRIYAWRETGSPDSTIFHGTTDNNAPSDTTKNHLIFTGLCEQSNFTIYDSHVEMSCTLSDYSKILDDTFWFNSPYYDAMRDVNVIYDIAQQVGFLSGEYDGDFDPASLVKKYAELPTSSEYSVLEHNGECYTYNDYVLPGHYDPLQNPLYKFPQGEAFATSLKKLAGTAGKTTYFDRFGVLHFDVPEDEEEMYNIDKASSERTFDRPPIQAAFFWTSNPDKASVEPDWTAAGVTNSGSICWNDDAFAIWNVVIGEYTFKRMQADTYNEIRIVSSTPEMKLLIGSQLNTQSLYDPTSQGFRGYKKVMFQQSGYFGSRAAVEKTIARYTTMFSPPSHASFTVLGRSGLRPMHTITLDGIGMSQPMRLVLTNVKNNIDASKNEWTTSLEGRYFYPGQMLSFKTNKYTLSPDSPTGSPSGTGVESSPI
tara:strand:+ start:3944 stop:8065 length:4122 start_codon:yes stop_codon:yes gene_type:complete